MSYPDQPKTAASSISGATVVGQSESERSLGELFADMSAGLGTLVRQELELAKVETKTELTQAGKAAGFLGAAGVSAHMALLFFSFALAWLLDSVMSRALAFALVGLLYAIVTAVLIAVGRARAKKVNPVPENTVASLKEDVQWAKAQKS
jgi:hypothetical protein